MDPHLLANLFKRSNYDDPIPSNFGTLDYLYEVLLEIRESENCDKVPYGVIPVGSLNKKHDFNDDSINSIDINCANNMQIPKLGDASFAISSTCCNDHDWGDSSYNIENLFKPHDEYEIDNRVCNIIESGFGRVTTLDPTSLENVQHPLTKRNKRGAPEGVILLIILKFYLSPMMNMRLIIVFEIILKVGLEECQL